MRKKTDLEMLESSSESDVEILDRPEVKRVRTAEPVPLLEDLANGNIEPQPEEQNAVQNVPLNVPVIVREEGSLLATPEGSSSDDNEIIEINDDESEDAVFHDENPNVDEQNGAIIISDSESEDSEPSSPEASSTASDDVIPKETFRRRISSGKISSMAHIIYMGYQNRLCIGFVAPYPRPSATVLCSLTHDQPLHCNVNMET